MRYIVDESGMMTGWVADDVERPGAIDAPLPDSWSLPAGMAWHWDGDAWIAATPQGGREPPVLIGMPLQQEAPAVTLEGAKETARRIVELAREHRIASGIGYTFNGVDERIQTRPIDLRNLTDVRGVALTLVLQGVANASIPFRTESNTDYVLTPLQALQMCAAVSMHGTACYQWAWGVKEQVDAAETVEAVAAILQSEGI